MSRLANRRRRGAARPRRQRWSASWRPPARPRRTSRSTRARPPRAATRGVAFRVPNESDTASTTKVEVVPARGRPDRVGVDDAGARLDGARWSARRRPSRSRCTARRSPRSSRRSPGRRRRPRPSSPGSSRSSRCRWARCPRWTSWSSRRSRRTPTATSCAGSRSRSTGGEEPEHPAPVLTLLPAEDDAAGRRRPTGGPVASPRRRRRRLRPGAGARASPVWSPGWSARRSAAWRWPVRADAAPSRRPGPRLCLTRRHGYRGPSGFARRPTSFLLVKRGWRSAFHPV